MDEARCNGVAGIVVILPPAGVIYQFVATKIDEYR
jgi:hypothetical protein